MGDMQRWTCNHFPQSNPSGAGQGDPAALLRRVADTIDELGDVVIHDIVYSSDQTGGGEEDLRITVYYSNEARHG